MSLLLLSSTVVFAAADMIITCTGADHSPERPAL